MDVGKGATSAWVGGLNVLKKSIIHCVLGKGSGGTRLKMKLEGWRLVKHSAAALAHCHHWMLEFVSITDFAAAVAATTSISTTKTEKWGDWRGKSAGGKWCLNT